MCHEQGQAAEPPAGATASAVRITAAKIRDLLQHSDAGRKQLMWRVLRELAVGEGK